MMRSMTAFGRMKSNADGREITVEIRSVNSRYLEVNVRSPRRYAVEDDRIKSYLREKGISRGKIDISITVEDPENDVCTIEPDDAYLRAYLKALYRIRDEYGLTDDITVMNLSKNPDIFRKVTPDSDSLTESDSDAFVLIRPVLDGAVDAFLLGREAEGKRLYDDIRKKIEGISCLLDKIGSKSLENIAAYRSRLEERLRAVLETYHVSADENRILTECAIFADKVAIDEELVRLGSHFRTFEEIAGSDGPAGRKLDFLIQEINREVNTIGSKSCESEIAHAVVDIKAEIEKIREQVQNIE